MTQNKQNLKALERNGNIRRDKKIRYTRQTNEWTKKFIWVTLTDDMLWCLDKVIRFYKRRLNKLNIKNVIEMQIQYTAIWRNIFLFFCLYTFWTAHKLTSICKICDYFMIYSIVEWKCILHALYISFCCYSNYGNHMQNAILIKVLLT